MAGTSWFSRTFARKSKGEKTKSDATNTGGVSTAAAGVGGGGTKTIGSSSGATGADEITRGVEALGTGSGSTATTASGSGTGRKMCVEDFEPLKLIGRGAFGALRCVAILFFFRASVGWLKSLNIPTRRVGRFRSDAWMRSFRRAAKRKTLSRLSFVEFKSDVKTDDTMGYL